MGILVGILEQGLIYGIIALGIYLTYTILDFPDLTVDGSFPLGAAVTVSLILRGVDPFATLVLSFLVGALAGLCTGLIHVKLKVRDLLSGIILMTALATINLVIAGKANVPIFNYNTIFNHPVAETLLPASLANYRVLILTAVVAFLCKFILDAYMNTKSGYLLRAAGDNPVLVTTLAKDPGDVKILGLAIANGLVALSGSILCQQQRYFEASMGIGTMVMGLASVIIGMKLFEKLEKGKMTTAALLGSIVYKACVALAIAAGLSPVSMKLITAILFLAVLVLNTDNPRRKKNAQHSKSH